MLSELTKFKVRTILVLDYKKRNDCKTFHSSGKLITSDWNVDDALKSMHQNAIMKIKHLIAMIRLLLKQS